MLKAAERRELSSRMASSDEVQAPTAAEVPTQLVGPCLIKAEWASSHDCSFRAVDREIGTCKQLE